MTSRFLLPSWRPMSADEDWPVFRYQQQRIEWLLRTVHGETDVWSWVVTESTE
jgi:hypothetical protein